MKPQLQHSCVVRWGSGDDAKFRDCTPDLMRNSVSLLRQLTGAALNGETITWQLRPGVSFTVEDSGVRLAQWHEVFPGTARHVKSGTERMGVADLFLVCVGKLLGTRTVKLEIAAQLLQICCLVGRARGLQKNELTSLQQPHINCLVCLSHYCPQLLVQAGGGEWWPPGCHRCMAAGGWLVFGQTDL